MVYAAAKFTGKNGKEYILRSPQEQDAEKLLAYLKQVAAETEFLLSSPEEIDFTVSDEEGFIRHYSEDQSSLLISAFDGEKIVGNASLCCVMNKRKTRHRAALGMAVLKSEWGQGIGRKMLTELITFAKQAGYEMLELEVADNNTAAISLYQKSGFTVCGQRPKAFKLKNGESCGELLMIRSLT